MQSILLLKLTFNLVMMVMAVLMLTPVALAFLMWCRQGFKKARSFMLRIEKIRAPWYVTFVLFALWVAAYSVIHIDLMGYSAMYRGLFVEMYSQLILALVLIGIGVIGARQFDSDVIYSFRFFRGVWRGDLA